MAGLIILASGVIHMNPRVGPTAWPVRALHVNTSHIFVPMIPAMIAAVIASAMQLPRLSVEMDMQRAQGCKEALRNSYPAHSIYVGHVTAYSTFYISFHFGRDRARSAPLSVHEPDG